MKKDIIFHSRNYSRWVASRPSLARSFVIIVIVLGFYLNKLKARLRCEIILDRLISSSQQPNEGVAHSNDIKLNRHNPKYHPHKV